MGFLQLKTFVYLSYWICSIQYFFELWNKNGLIIFHVNIYSLGKHFDKFETYLIIETWLLNSFSNKSDVLAGTKTLYINSPEFLYCLSMVWCIVGAR